MRLPRAERGRARTRPASEIASPLQEQPIAAEHSAADRSDAVPPPFPYGVDYPDTDQWLDQTGAVHRGDGPYVHRPLRRLRRALGRWLR